LQAAFAAGGAGVGVGDGIVVDEVGDGVADGVGVGVAVDEGVQAHSARANTTMGTDERFMVFPSVVPSILRIAPFVRLTCLEWGPRRATLVPMDDDLKALLASFPPGTLIEKLGIQIREASASRVVGVMPVEGNLQPQGLLHGGATAALAETLGSLAARAHAGAGMIAMGVDLNVTHHRAATAGLVTGVATPLYAGKTTATYGIDVTNEAGERVATARLTCAIRPQPAL
jgi:1,4-dihydroxy-2-naphthoyl-CoA hydrolase